MGSSTNYEQTTILELRLQSAKNMLTVDFYNQGLIRNQLNQFVTYFINLEHLKTYNLALNQSLPASLITPPEILFNDHFGLEMV